MMNKETEIRFKSALGYQLIYITISIDELLCLLVSDRATRQEEKGRRVLPTKNYIISRQQVFQQNKQAQ
jgi:hypothetical protein